MERGSEHGNALPGPREMAAPHLHDHIGEEGHRSGQRGAEGQVVNSLGLVDGCRGGEYQIPHLEEL